MVPPFLGAWAWAAGEAAGFAAVGAPAGEVGAPVEGAVVGAADGAGLEAQAFSARISRTASGATMKDARFILLLFPPYEL